MAKIAVTGGSGKLGRACVRDLVEHDLRAEEPLEEMRALFIRDPDPGIGDLDHRLAVTPAQ